MYPFVAGLGPMELALILAVIVLLFGAAKLPELARGSGRALRIFKAETKGLHDDDDDLTPEQREIEARRTDPGAGPIVDSTVEAQSSERRNGDTTT